MQERSKKGAVIRSASASEPELQAWLHSALKGLTSGTEVQGQIFEVDSDGNGLIESGVDLNNSELGVLLSAADGLCSQYAVAKQALHLEMSPWALTIGSLWQVGAGAPGRITCSHRPNASFLNTEIQDSTGQTIYQKVIYAG